MKRLSDRDFEKMSQGWPRRVCCEMMLATRHSPLPDRPMLPGSKMSGGDLPVADVELPICVPGWISSLDNAEVSGHIDIAGEAEPAVWLVSGAAQFNMGDK